MNDNPLITALEELRDKIDESIQLSIIANRKLKETVDTLQGLIETNE